ncbi:post-GPI attachment to proteins factor 6-like [Aphidius gifuensis]|nr:post-GPI attachment to proteins factor 6-like [Aphidius gifuensis]
MSKIKILDVFFLLTYLLSITHYINCDELIKIFQQGQTELDDYTGYQDVSIIHFNVPDNLASVTFKFTAKELKLSGLGSCTPRDVSIYLKLGSIPLVHPDGASVNTKLLNNRRKYYEVNFTSGGDQYDVKITTPTPGDWFAIAFRSWTDPNSEKITQQGLGTICSTILDADLLVEKIKLSMIMDINNKYNINLNNSLNTALLKFLIDDNYHDIINISITSSCGDNCKISINIIADDVIKSTQLNSTNITLSFKPYIQYFHHLTFELLSGNSTVLSIFLPKNINNNNNNIILNDIPLVRKSLPDLFLFDYEYIPGNSTEQIPINITADKLTIMNFKIGPINDIGGTLSIGIKLVNKTDDIIVIGCISLGYITNITAGGGCKRNDVITTSDIWANSTKPITIHIPYPDPGIWHLTIRAFKLIKENNKLSINNNNCTCIDKCQIIGCDDCECFKKTTTKIETNIGSSPCIEGGCNKNGHCHHHPNSGGFIITSCHCTGGYRGFDCTDNTYVLTSSTVKIHLLMLTMSNLAFIGSIYIAYKREYYSESIVYTAVMFFSIFYHACEAGEDIINICITKISVLQFCDFYNALLSIWVTLIAMTSFGQKLTCFLQIFGAIVLAFCAEIDRTALWVFLLPTLSGCILIGFAWGMRCHRQRNFKYPALRYRSVYLSTGLGIVFVGLICYAFLQTRKNYHVLHSFWHICTAIGIMLLLPKKKYMK